MVIHSWFGYGAGNNMIKKVMVTNEFLSQFKLKSLSQSTLIHVLLLLIVIVGLGFFFLLILLNIQIIKICLFIFCYKIIIYLFFNTVPLFFLGLHARGAAAPSAPLLPAVLGVNWRKAAPSWSRESEGSLTSSGLIGKNSYTIMANGGFKKYWIKGYH